MSDDYIRREAALDACFNGWGMEPKDCAENIRKIPAADVVEVVRCSECQKGKWDPWTGAIWCEGRNRRPEFYCADGERKNGGQDNV